MTNLLTVRELQSFIPLDWLKILRNELEESYWINIVKILNETKIFYPPKKEIFNALNVSPNNVKVVLIGQDPYHGSNQAEGLSFSVKENITIPPSLKNMFIQLCHKYSCKYPHHGSLKKWMNEGVLMLNTVLTVAHGKPKSHSNIGWERFTSSILKYLDKNHKFVVMALGNDAIKIANNNIMNNPIVTSGHPSPMNTVNPFNGNTYVRVNKDLHKLGLERVNWEIICENTN